MADCRQALGIISKLLTADDRSFVHLSDALDRLQPLQP